MLAQDTAMCVVWVGVGEMEQCVSAWIKWDQIVLGAPVLRTGF